MNRYTLFPTDNPSWCKKSSTKQFIHSCCNDNDYCNLFISFDDDNDDVFNYNFNNDDDSNQGKLFLYHLCNCYFFYL